MTLRESLARRPVIYEIVPPRKDTSRYSTELRGVEEVLEDGRIGAINIPELIKRRTERGSLVYSPATMPPEDYAMMIRDRKEPIVNVIAPRLEKGMLLARVKKILVDYRVPNLVLVGRERAEDALPGPEVVEAMELVSASRPATSAIGGICIFSRRRGKGGASEAERVLRKSRAGCDFVTAQISFEADPALGFLESYQALCEAQGADPVTVFLSLTTVPSASILSLLESLDVVIPPKVKKTLLGAGSMGKESLKVASEVFRRFVSEVDRRGIAVPLGLQIEQVGVNNDALSLELLDATFPSLRR